MARELQHLGDWRSSMMVERYAHLAPDDLAKAAGSSIRCSVVTIWLRQPQQRGRVSTNALIHW